MEFSQGQLTTEYMLFAILILSPDFNFVTSATSVVASLCMECGTEENFLNHPRREEKKK